MNRENSIPSTATRRRVSYTARKVNLGTLSHQRLFAPSDAPELAQLVANFNELLDRVEAAHPI